MTQGQIHYEAAFAEFLRRRGLAFVPMRDLRPSLPDDVHVKGFDFLVHTADGGEWLAGFPTLLSNTPIPNSIILAISVVHKALNLTLWQFT